MIPGFLCFPYAIPSAWIPINVFPFSFWFHGFFNTNSSMHDSGNLGIMANLVVGTLERRYFMQGCFLLVVDVNLLDCMYGWHCIGSLDAW